METALDESMERQLEWGTMRTMTSLTGWAQTVQGPVQYFVSFLTSPVTVWGVKSQTFVPGRNVFRS